MDGMMKPHFLIERSGVLALGPPPRLGQSVIRVDPVRSSGVSSAYRDVEFRGHQPRGLRPGYGAARNQNKWFKLFHKWRIFHG